MQQEENIERAAEPIDSPAPISDILTDDFSLVAEALLFASPEPLDDGEIARIAGCRKRDVPAIISELNENYVRWRRSFRVEKFGSGYRIYTLPEYDKYIRRLAEIPRPVKLSRAALEVLSIVAFRQPTPRSEIERIRGINPDGVLRTLLDKGLIEISGRSDGPGRPLLYGTTREFLDFFGISDLSELPAPDIAETEENIRGLVLKRLAEGETSSASSNENQ